jgi:hypothetical protein
MVRHRDAVGASVISHCFNRLFFFSFLSLLRSTACINWARPILRFMKRTSIIFRWCACASTRSWMDMRPMSFRLCRSHCKNSSVSLMNKRMPMKLPTLYRHGLRILLNVAYRRYFVRELVPYSGDDAVSGASLEGLVAQGNVFWANEKGRNRKFHRPPARRSTEACYQYDRGTGSSHQDAEVLTLLGSFKQLFDPVDGISNTQQAASHFWPVIVAWMGSCL